MLSFAIAVRFLRKSLAQSILIAAGIAIGIGVQVFLGSLIISLQADLVDQTIGGRSQVTVRAATDGEPLIYTQDVRDAIAGQQGITTQAPVREFSAILRVGEQTRPLQFTAGEVDQLDTIYGLSERAVAALRGSAARRWSSARISRRSWGSSRGGGRRSFSRTVRPNWSP